MSIQRFANDRVVGGFNHCRKMQQHLFGLFALGNVTHKTREKTLAGQINLAHRKVHWKYRAILPTAGDLTSNADDLRPAGPAIFGEITIMLLVIWRGHQDIDISADDLSGLITKNALGCGIHRLDDAALVNRDNALNSR